MSEKKPEKAPSLEETFSQIESIIEKMESPEVTLDESFGLYTQGIDCLKHCNILLDEVEKKMLVLNAEGEDVITPEEL